MATSSSSRNLHPILVSSLDDIDTFETDIEPSFNHHLVLHFDINETILVGDEAGGDSRKDSINKMLAKSAFVCMLKNNVSYEATSSLKPTHWWNGLPIQEQYEESINVPPLYIGWKWPDKCCPYYRTKFKKRAKTFVDHHGSLYADLYHKLEEALQPKDPQAAVDYPILSHMLPSFFETIMELSKRSQPINIVFRTMGTDLPGIAEAFVAFCSGQHPDYPHFSNPDFILKPDRLVQGRWCEQENGDCVYQLWKNGNILASGDAEVLEFIHAQPVCGIQDDYPFWTKNHWEPWAGKPVWILDDIQHIILDDNIHNLPHDSIASAREKLSDGSFRTLTGPEIQQQQGRHLIRVPTVAPVLRPTWFLEQIAAAQHSFVSRKHEKKAPKR